MAVHPSPFETARLDDGGPVPDDRLEALFATGRAPAQPTGAPETTLPDEVIPIAPVAPPSPLATRARTNAARTCAGASRCRSWHGTTMCGAC